MPFAFIHVRKTAGTSFRANLLEALQEMSGGNLNDCKIRSSVELRAKLTPGERAPYLKSFDFISGHFNDLGSYIDLSAWSTFMFFRNPISRCISAYNHMMRDITDPLHKYCRNLSFDQAIDLPELSSEFRNPYYKYLVGNFNCSRADPQDCTEPSAHSLLQYIDFVGITEMYELSLKLFQLQSGGKIIFKGHKRLNTKITKDGLSLADIDVKVIAKLMEQNSLDLSIYKAALSLFSARGSNAVNSLYLHQ